MRALGRLVLRVVIAITLVAAVIITAVTGSAAILVAAGVSSLADGYSLVHVATVWALTIAGLLSVSRLAYLAARALGPGGRRR